MTDTHTRDAAARLYVRGLALCAASLLAGGEAGDTDVVTNLAAPILAWAGEGDGTAADLEVRGQALAIHLDNMRTLLREFGDLNEYTPEGFAAAADGYYRSLRGGTAARAETTPGVSANGPGYTRIHPDSGLTPRQAFAIRNLLLAATEPEAAGPSGDPGGWRRLVTDATRYGRSAHPPLSHAEYEQAWHALFAGDRRATAAGPSAPRPDTAGYADPDDPATWPFPDPGEATLTGRLGDLVREWRRAVAMLAGGSPAHVREATLLETLAQEVETAVGAGFLSAPAANGCRVCHGPVTDAGWPLWDITDSGGLAGSALTGHEITELITLSPSLVITLHSAPAGWNGPHRVGSGQWPFAGEHDEGFGERSGDGRGEEAERLALLTGSAPGPAGCPAVPDTPGETGGRQAGVDAGTAGDGRG